MTAAREPLARLFLPRIGLRRIEQRALKCIDKCGKKLGWTETPLPVPVEACIEGPLNIRFGIADLSHLGADVLGAAYIQSREILISQQVLANEGRFRFTCAHELGHFILHGRHSGTFTDRETPDFRLHSKIEWQANSFAASFLMPARILEKELLAVCADNRLDTQHCLSELLLPTSESIWLWKTIFLGRLAERFNVSKAALLVRCSDLRLASSDESPLLPRYVRDQLLLARVTEPAQFIIRDGRPISRAVV